MSQQRLQELREEFEALLSADHYNVAGWPAEHVAPNDILFKQPVLDAARRYIIARDFGEFDPKRALMLWRLQNNK